MADKKKGEKKNKHPFMLLLLCLIFLGLSSLGWIRVQQTIQNWNLILSWFNPFLLVYLMVYGITWGLVGIFSAIELWIRSKVVKPVVYGAILYYPLTFWIEKIFILKSSTRFANWPFDLGFTVCWILFGLIAFHTSKRHP